MIKIELKVKRTKSKDYKTEVKGFESLEAFDIWYSEQILDETHRKILSFKQLNN